MEWINANKKKPRSGKLVMIYTPNRTILKSPVLMGRYWTDSKDWTVYDFESSKYLIVTHWAVIPGAPI